jgi:hypothetical protein
MEKDKLERHITIIGRVILHEGNGFDNYYIEILTDEDVYAVELDYVGEQLLGFAGQNIKAVGYLNKYSDGSLRILVDDYELIAEDILADDENICVERDFDYPDDYFLENEH